MRTFTRRVGSFALLTNIDADGPWMPWQNDLTPYLGSGKIRIEFKGVNNATLPTEWDLDDVTVWVQ